MGEPLIQIPTAADIPSDLRPAKNEQPLLKPRLLKVSAADIPRVLGWQVLILPVAIPTETESGLQLSPNTIRQMNLSRRVGVVLALGPLAFSVKRGYPTDFEGAQVGDWVQFHENSGVDALIRGEEDALVGIKYIPDGEVLSVIPNPDSFMVMV